MRLEHAVSLSAAATVLLACASKQSIPQTSPCQFTPTPIDVAKQYRLRDGLLYGEKATSALDKQRRDAPLPGPCGVRQLQPGDRVNALGVLDIYLQNAEHLIQDIRDRGYNVVLSPEIRRAGEQSWLRLESPNRYYRRIAALDVDQTAIRRQLMRIAGLSRDTTDEVLDELLKQRINYTGDRSKPNPHANNRGCLSHYNESQGIQGLAPRNTDPAFEVSRTELERNQWLREGSWVPVLFFYDLLQRFDCPYLRDLRAAARHGRPLLSLSLAELPVVSAENSPQLYRAKAGDRLRIRILAAEQDVRQRDRTLQMVKAEKLPDVREYYLTTRLSLADDVEFLVADYGLQLQVVPAVSYASGTGLEVDQFNPIRTAPAITSAFYLRYEGRRRWLSRLQWVPGAFMSLLSLEGADTRFTAGLSWSPPAFRRWVNFVYGWHDLRRPIIGLAISPNVDFKAMLARDTPGQ